MTATALATVADDSGNALTLDLIERANPGGEFLVSEAAFAASFAENNRHRLRFVSEDRKWIAFTGTHWSIANAETLAEAAFEEEIGDLLKQAAQDERARQGLIVRAEKLATARMRRNVLALAQPMMMISRSAFDRDAADLLNTPSGMINLRTGEVTGCDPARMLTQCTAVAYDPDAPFPERFGEIVTALADDDAETEDWLWRALGYTLTGHAWEDAVFYLRGSGSNGKSTLLKAVAAVLGMYAHKIDIRFLTAGADAGHATEYAALRGKRLVYTSEVEKGQRLAISRLKDLTGGDVQKHRGMHQDADAAAEFAPVAKVWMAGNHDLAIHGNDHGTWRRIHKIKSTKTFAHSSVRDGLAEAEGAGILAALVAAARAWYEGGGLGAVPAGVAAATAAYRKQEDMAGRFFADCLEFGKDTPDERYRISKNDLNDAYRDWLLEEGADFKAGPRELATRLDEMGVSECRGEGADRRRYWVGVRRKRGAEASATAPRTPRFGRRAIHT